MVCEGGAGQARQEHDTCEQRSSLAEPEMLGVVRVSMVLHAKHRLLHLDVHSTWKRTVCRIDKAWLAYQRIDTTCSVSVLRGVHTSVPEPLCSTSSLEIIPPFDSAGGALPRLFGAIVFGF